jgi:hypothetical protein
VLLGRILQERKERCCGIVIAILWAWRSLFGFGREAETRWMGQNQARFNSGKQPFNVVFGPTQSDLNPVVIGG